jgi:hypothetical protein
MAEVWSAQCSVQRGSACWVLGAWLAGAAAIAMSAHPPAMTMAAGWLGKVHT